MSKLKSIKSLLSGYVRVHDNLTYYEKDYVVTNSRNDRNDSERVKLISGGGAGHEPAHTGYVGDGMLTTSVSGELYSSPSAQHILNAMLLTGSPNTSILFIVKNYTGDRLNFGLAIEIARNQFNYKNIDMVIINDDISIDDDKVQPSVGRRGLAGAVFYHKIIGAMAANKEPIEAIVQYVHRLLAKNIICTIGSTFTTNIPDGISDIEIGKGIHGEPGIEFIKNLENFDKIYQTILEKFLKKIPKTSNIVLMVNNLGGTSQFTMSIFLNEISQVFSEHYKIIKTYTGTFLTSLKSEGISVTLINLSDPKDLIDITGYLEHETSVPCNIFEKNVKSAINEKSVIHDAIKFENSASHQRSLVTSKFENDMNGVLFKNIVVRIVQDLIENTDLLNKMDMEFGDGDTGTTMGRFVEQIDLQIKNGEIVHFGNPKLILLQLADIAQSVVGGTIGAIYCLFLHSLAAQIGDDSIVDLHMWAEGINTGVATVIKYGHAQKGDRTLLEPLFACADALQNFTTIQNLNKLCDDAVTSTQNLIPKSGRAAYTFSVNKADRKAKYPDPGAKAIGLMVNAITDEITKFK